MRAHRCLREEEEIRGVGVHQCDQIGQGGAIDARFLGDNSEGNLISPPVGGDPACWWQVSLGLNEEWS